MLNTLTYNQYVHCLQELLLKSFEDKRLRVHFILSLVLLGVGIVSMLSTPFLLKTAVDSFTEGSSTVVPFILISYGFMWMVSQASLHIRALLTYKIEQRITFTLGVKVLSHLYGLSQRYFLEQKPGALTNVIRRAQNDVPSIILGIFFHTFPTILEFLCVVALVAYLYPITYSLLLGGTLVAFFIYTTLSMKTTMKVRENANEVDKETDGTITDWLSNHEAIRIFGQKSLAITICDNELKKREDAEVAFMVKFSSIRLGQSLILGIGLIALTSLVGKDVLSKTLTIGDFVLFNGYILQFIVPISILGQEMQEIKKALVDMRGIFKILLTENEIKEASSPLHLPSQALSIEFRNVSFTYKDRAIIDDLSFKVEPGETILIVGPTGIGKSTIAKLLLRLYDPTKGQILFNHTNLNQFSFQSLYETIGWVPQESALFNDTIENNLRFVRPESTQEEIEIALDRASLHGFVNKLPEGIKTQVGDRGLKLSGGEKQRLSIARLFLKNPKICILDEATSFLDRNTELIIQKNIETFIPDMTKIIITHRPFMIEKAHKIITLSAPESIGCEEAKNLFFKCYLCAT